MAIRKHVYLCPLCSSTKTIVEDTVRIGRGAQTSPPSDLYCGWRGCNGRMIRSETKEVHHMESLDGLAITAEAKRRYHFEAEFKMIVEYSVMFALAEGHIHSVSIEAFTDIKERIRMAAAMSLVIKDEREKRVDGTGT